MKSLDDLAQTIDTLTRRNSPAQIRLVTCERVNWEEKTMDATGVSDDDPYVGIMLGLGAINIKPETGSVCIIGILEGKESYAFLINAEEIELIEYNSKSIVFNEGRNNGLLNVKQVTEKFNALERDLNTIKRVFTTWIPIYEASLKTGATPWATNPLAITMESELQDTSIKH